MIEGSHDFLGEGDYFVMRCFYSRRSEFFSIEVFDTFADECNQFCMCHSSDFCKNAQSGKESVRIVMSKMLLWYVESYGDKSISAKLKHFNTVQ